MILRIKRFFMLTIVYMGKACCKLVTRKNLYFRYPITSCCDGFFVCSGCNHYRVNRALYVVIVRSILRSYQVKTTNNDVYIIFYEVR